MNTRLYLFSIVAFLMLTVSPHAIGKIDPQTLQLSMTRAADGGFGGPWRSTVAGLWLFEEGDKIMQNRVLMEILHQKVS